MESVSFTFELNPPELFLVVIGKLNNVFVEHAHSTLMQPDLYDNSYLPAVTVNRHRPNANEFASFKLREQGDLFWFCKHAAKPYRGTLS